MKDFIVSDTGPLISLEKLAGGYDFIGRLYEKLIVPEEVIQEVSHRYESPFAYIEHFEIGDLLDIRSISTSELLPQEFRLHQGEIAAIHLAISLKLPLLIEETVGRKIASKLGIPISGIGGQIVKSHREGLLGEVEAIEMLREMLENKRINEKVFLGLVEGIKKSA